MLSLSASPTLISNPQEWPDAEPLWHTTRGSGWNLPWLLAEPFVSASVSLR